jgi:hypothetical protein
MGNKYYTHHSIKDYQEGSIFANVYTWTIFDILRLAGSRGLTAPEVHRHVEETTGTQVSQSKIYDLLKRLYEGKWIHRYYDREVERQRCTIALDWGGISVEEEFEELIIKKERAYIRTHLFPVFMNFIRKAIRDFREDPYAEKWIPQTDGFCKVCRNGKSHEALEFFNSLLDEATAEFMDSNEFHEFMKDNRYAKKGTTS